MINARRIGIGPPWIFAALGIFDFQFFLWKIQLSVLSLQLSDIWNAARAVFNRPLPWACKHQYLGVTSHLSGLFSW
jgi:hypothetical protein